MKSGARDWLDYGLWWCEPCQIGCVVKGFADYEGNWKVVAVLSGSEGVLAGVSRLVELLNEKLPDNATKRAAFEVIKAIEQEGFTFATELELEHVTAELDKVAGGR